MVKQEGSSGRPLQAGSRGECGVHLLARCGISARADQQGRGSDQANGLVNVFFSYSSQKRGPKPVHSPWTGQNTLRALSQGKFSCPQNRTTMVLPHPPTARAYGCTGKSSTTNQRGGESKPKLPSQTGHRGMRVLTQNA